MTVDARRLALVLDLVDGSAAARWREPLPADEGRPAHEAAGRRVDTEAAATSMSTGQILRLRVLAVDEVERWFG